MTAQSSPAAAIPQALPHAVPPQPLFTLAGGRPRALDESLKHTVATLLVRGMSFAQAAAYVGCDRRTIANERRRDAEFDCNVKRALAMRNIESLEIVRRAGKTSWRAAAWLLEYRRRLKKDALAERRVRAESAAASEPAKVVQEEVASNSRRHRSGSSFFPASVKARKSRRQRRLVRRSKPKSSQRVKPASSSPASPPVFSHVGKNSPALAASANVAAAHP